MAPFTFALLAIITASLASAGPVAIDNATLLLNGEEALTLNCQFQNLQNGGPCSTGDTGCVQGETATCVNGAWQTQPCPSSKSCFALPSVRTNGTFIACTSPNNAASIIAATGVQTNIANNCTSLGNSSFPFSTPNITSPGDCGQNATQGSNVGGETSPVTTNQPILTLPPTTTTLSPAQASQLFSFLSADGLSPPSSVPGSESGNVNSLGGNASGTPPIILLTSSPTLTPTPTSSQPN